MYKQTTARKEDINGWIEIQGNPITKVGVFPYFGSQIDPDGENPAIIPDKVYSVYRPPEELMDPACQESFKLVPWIDDHTMLGNCGIPTEYKGVDGVIGEKVYFDEPYLRANLKIYAQRLAEAIQSGKKELSIGYRCLYEPSAGVYNGVHYEFIQRCIRGNHVALVVEGRAGPDVKVLDSFKLTFDEALIMSFKKAADEGAEEKKDEDKKDMQESKDEGAEGEKESKPDITEALAQLKSLAEPISEFLKVVQTFNTAANGSTLDDEDPMSTGTSTVDSKNVAMDAQIKTLNDKIAKLEKTNNELKASQDNMFKSFMETANERDALVAKLSPVIGTFDHKTMTLKEVAKYGVEKLGLECTEDGQELTLLRGYLAAKQANTTVNQYGNFTADTTEINSDSPLRKHLVQE